MKKLTALISALALLLSLCACSSQAGGPKRDDAPESGAASQAVNGEQDAGTKEPPVIPVVEPNVPKSGGESQPPADAPEAPDPAPAPDPVPAAPSHSTQTPAPEPEPDPVPVPPPSPKEPVPAADPKTTAQGLIGRPVSELYAAIGQPISSDYAPGCLEPDSEDGELTYSGFIVYTVRTATREYVYDVL